jgi:hypothetical protein
VSGELHASACRFTPWERAPVTHSIGGLVGPRAGLDDAENRKFLTLPGLELRAIVQPVASRYTEYAIPVTIQYLSGGTEEIQEITLG